MRVLGPDRIAGHDVYQIFVSDLRAWPDRLALVSPKFVLFLATSYARPTSRTLTAVAKKALDAGAVYICALGPSARAVERAFDWEIVERCELRGRPSRLSTVIPTTSHSDLADAVFFFLQCASPATAYAKSCRSWLAVTAGDPALARRVTLSLAAHRRRWAGP